MLSQCHVPLEGTDHLVLEFSECLKVWRFEPDLEGQTHWLSGDGVEWRCGGCMGVDSTEVSSRRERGPGQSAGGPMWQRHVCARTSSR